MNEGFASFFKKKKEETKPSSTKPKKPDYQAEHDHYTDQVMHHLTQLHKLTHPNGHWATMNQHKSRSSRKISDLHDHAKDLLTKFGHSSKAF